jgi:hypothetical protein
MLAQRRSDSFIGNRTRASVYSNRFGVSVEKFGEEVFAVVDESADDLRGGNVFDGDLVDMTAVEREDLRAGVTEQDGEWLEMMN